MKEAKVLLKHPDPRERALALKLSSVTPQDIAVGILDPHPLVWKTAFYHPNANHALDVLSCFSRDAAGNAMHEQHNLLLQDPRCTKDHIYNIQRALQQDSFLPVVIQNERLNKVNELSKLVKKEAIEYLEHSTDPLEKKIKVSQEPVKHPELNGFYKASKPVIDELSNKGNFQKAIKQYDINGVNHKFIVKPYYEQENHLGGWAEASSQHLYHAANIGHLHQKSFVGDYNNDINEKIPATVIHVEKAKPVLQADEATLAKNPNIREDAQKIAIMDFLTGNDDRHTGNIMVRDNGEVLAIDHSLAFSYKGDPYNTERYIPCSKYNSHFGKYTIKEGIRSLVPGVSKDRLTNDTVNYHNVIKQWWPEVAADVNRAFNERLELISNPTLKRHLTYGFNARFNWLTKAVGIGHNELLTELKKAVAQPLIDTPIIEPEHEHAHRYGTVHNELLNTHPKEFQNSVDTFEKYVNHPTNPVKPDLGSLDGIEYKALVNHGGQKYLIKSASSYLAPLSGWAEMTSQAMYHAGGLGHLHQNVHATHLNIKENGSYRKQPAIVIHFKPGKWESFHNTQDLNPKHDQDLRKAYIMDFLTGNSDRHGGNLLVNSNSGEPQFIDQSFAFRRDNNDNPEDQYVDSRAYLNNIKEKKQDRNQSPFNYGLFAKTNELNYRKFLPNDQTWQWWNQNKNNIVAAFNKNLQMIPDKIERANRKAYFDLRVKDTDAKHPVIFGSQLNKALGDGGFLHDQHLYQTFPLQQGMKANVSGVHEKLMKAHPAIVNPSVRHFELALNNSKNVIKPTKQQKELEGTQPKALYHHNNKGYLIKPATENSTALGAWNELTSQAMYHAGNIGHLHQKVHATVAKTGLNRQEQAHALVIHMEDDVLPWGDAHGYHDKEGKFYPPKDESRITKTLTNPVHKQNLKKLGLMGYLTAHHDDHLFNTVVKPDGSVVSLDHSRDFYNDRKHAYGEEYTGELSNNKDLGITEDPLYQNRWFGGWDSLKKNSISALYGEEPDQDTWKWWDESKGPMLQKFKEHVAMLPEPEAQQKMINSFMTRYNNLESMRDSASKNRSNVVQSLPKTSISNTGSLIGFEPTAADHIERTEPDLRNLPQWMNK